MRDAHEVLADERVLALVVHVDEGGLEAAARVVHQDVDGVERVDPGAHRFAVADVEQLGVHMAAVGDRFLGRASEAVGIAVADGEVGAEARQRRGDLGPDALRGPGDDGAATGQEDGVRRDRHRGRRLASPP